MRALLRMAVVAGLAVVLLTLTGGSASAVQLGNPIHVGNPITGLADKLCPSKNAPTPEMPDSGLPPGPGDYEKYGYGGLTWTTYDQSCLSTAKLDNGFGNAVNDLATGLDGLVNQAQAAALDPHFTAPLRRVADQAVPQLRAAFLDPWLKEGLAGAAIVLLIALAFGRETEMVRVVLNVFVVLGVLFFIAEAPGRVSQASADATAGVASSSGKALAGATGTPVADPAAAFTDAYYSLSYRAWADGAWCFQRGAEARWGPRIRNDQAYTVAEAAQIAADPASATGIKKAKQDDWVKAADEMSKSDPAAYDCWSGSSSSRLKSGIRHLVASVLAGIWVLLCALGLLILQAMLLLAILLLMGIGAILLAFRRSADRMFEFLIVAAVGAPFVALILGILLTGYFAVMSDPNTSWLSAVILSVSLGAAVWFSRPFLRRLFVGLSAVDESHRVVQRTRRGVTRTATTAAGAFVGGEAAGAGVGRQLNRRQTSGDDRAPDPLGVGDTRRSGSRSPGGDIFIFRSGTPDRASEPGSGSHSPGAAPSGPGVPIAAGERSLTGDARQPGVDPEPVPVPGSTAHPDDRSAPVLTDEQPDREFPVPAAAGDSPAPERRSSLTRDEEESWRTMASAQLERFGHDPMAPPPDDVMYLPPPVVSGDDPTRDEPARDERS